LKSFAATGSSPANANVILQRFAHQQPDEQEQRESSSRLSLSDWRQMDRLVRASVKDSVAKEGKKPSASLHYLHIHNELLCEKNKGLREALEIEQKHKKKGKALDLQKPQEYHSSAAF
jgi:hypothetical protein